MTTSRAGARGAVAARVVSQVSDGPPGGAPEVCSVARSHAPNEALRA